MPKYENKTSEQIAVNTIDGLHVVVFPGQSRELSDSDAAGLGLTLVASAPVAPAPAAQVREESNVKKGR